MKLLTCFLFIFFSLQSQNSYSQELPPDSVTTFKNVEVMASVDREEWVAHLQRELGPVIEKASKKLDPGRYVINVRFLIERDGSISNCRALNEPATGIGQMVEDVVRIGLKWKPGMQNGKIVRSFHTQPITFIITK
jgi:periplasmic protein TonB